MVGLAKIVTAAYPDPSQFDASSVYFDAKSTPAMPRWFSVDIQLLEQFQRPLSLAQIKADPALAEMALLRQPRLSITPVQNAEAERMLMRCATSGSRAHYTKS